MATAPLPEPLEGKAAAEQKLTIERERQRRRWDREGHNPWGHLVAITAEGDATLFREWVHIEQNHPRGTPLERRYPSIMAAFDMREIASRLWEIEWARRQRAAP